MTHNSCDDNPESERDMTRHAETATAYSTTRQDQPVFIPTNRDWFYLGSQDTPSVRQVEIIQRPTGTYIGSFNDEVPSTENITDHSEDHNWRRKKENPHRREEAVFENNWPKPRKKHKHDMYINKQYRPDRSVVRQISKRPDGYQIVNNMNNST